MVPANARSKREPVSVRERPDWKAVLSVEDRSAQISRDLVNGVTASALNLSSLPHCGKRMTGTDGC